MTVSQVSQHIKYALAEHFPAKIKIVGEISNLSNRNHWYFSLKDRSAALRCVCFASSARRIKFPVKDGMEVVATGRVDYYDAQGSVQLYVDKLEPVGMGSLELQLRERMEELRQLGYFDPARKMMLPMMPGKIAVVTSRSAAALQDVINTAKRRWPACQLLLKDVRVQGDAAAGEIARAIRKLSADGKSLGIDAIILTRGGGSIEDLWAFNERVVADALHTCHLPVVAAIGHETDTTIAELVADHRCSTPTQAAMMLVPDGRAMWHQVSQLDSRLTLLVKRQLEHNKHRLRHAYRHPLFRSPDQLVAQQGQRLAFLESRLLPGLRNRVSREKARVDQNEMRLKPVLGNRAERLGAYLEGLEQRLKGVLPREVSAMGAKLEALEKQLNAVGPRSVLARGFSYTTDDEGNLIRSAKDVQEGVKVVTHMKDGVFRSTVDGVEAGEHGNKNVRAGEGKKKDGVAKSVKTKRAAQMEKTKIKEDESEQPSLF